MNSNATVKMKDAVRGLIADSLAAGVEAEVVAWIAGA
jgi:hypothetical protein